MKASIRNGVAAAVVALMCLCAAACGSGVSGHTYQDKDGMVKIEFESGGKAVTTMGPITANCTYTEKDKQVLLTCADQTTPLAVGSDGNLTGPPDGMLDRLTRVK